MTPRTPTGSLSKTTTVNEEASVSLGVPTLSPGAARSMATVCWTGTSAPIREPGDSGRGHRNPGRGPGGRRLVFGPAVTDPTDPGGVTAGLMIAVPSGGAVPVAHCGDSP